MSIIVVYDACVLWSAPLRDLLMRLAIAGLVQAKWTETILDETFRAIHSRRPDLSIENLARTRALLNRSVRDCLVSSTDELVRSLHLPDPNDRHVLGAALAPHQMEAVHPDDLVLDLLYVAEGAVLRVLQEQATVLRNPARGG